jgi:hypothetical protein
LKLPEKNDRKIYGLSAGLFCLARGGFGFRYGDKRKKTETDGPERTGGESGEAAAEHTRAAA